MREAVSDILVDRAREAEGLARAVGLSFVAHVVLIAVVAVLPANWGSAIRKDDRPVMTISLGGAPGPRAGGMTPIGGRAIQEAVPLPDVKRPIPAAPPAAKKPEMVEPAPAAKKPAATRPSPKPAPDQARGRKPTTGAEVQPGSAIVETGAKGTAFGLSTGGGGAGMYVDLGNFCCPAYLETMTQLIRRNWDEKQQVPGETVIKFVIQRDGTLTGIEEEKVSGYYALDAAAKRAVLLTRRLPPLPPEFPEKQLTVYLEFRYQR
jgi:TonB family protein